MGEREEEGEWRGWEWEKDRAIGELEDWTWGSGDNGCSVGSRRIVLFLIIRSSIPVEGAKDKSWKWKGGGHRGRKAAGH